MQLNSSQRDVGSNATPKWSTATVVLARSLRSNGVGPFKPKHTLETGRPATADKTVCGAPNMMERFGSSKGFIGNTLVRVSIRSRINGLVASQFARESSNSKDVLNQRILAGQFRSIQDLWPKNKGREG